MNIIPDVIVTWPRNVDYPIWRQFIHDNRSRFNKVFIAFTETYHGDDYRAFVMEAMAPDYCQFIQPLIQTGVVDDWRNVAVNHALIHSFDTEWIWFTEEDFFVTDDVKFWEEVSLAASMGIEAIGVKQGERLHPACLFMKRSALEKTRKNFGIIPDVSDHFSMIQEDIEKGTIPLAVLTPGTYSHMNGLSHNFRLVCDGELPVYHPDEFYSYIRHCLDVTVPLDPRFIQIAESALRSVAPES